MITVNGCSTEFEGTVAELVASRHDTISGIAVALNGEVVPRTRWETSRPEDGDHVEIVTAVQGG